jgi:hypothetical protein
MKQRSRVNYSDEQKALMWDRRQKGDSMHAIARLFARGRSPLLNSSDFWRSRRPHSVRRPFQLESLKYLR